MVFETFAPQKRLRGDPVYQNPFFSVPGCVAVLQRNAGVGGILSFMCIVARFEVRAFLPMQRRTP